MEKVLVSILKKFYNFNKHRFRDLKGKIPSNKCSYYLKKLVNGGYLEKERDFYIITSKGEEYLTYLDKDQDFSLIKQPLQDVLLFPVKGRKYLFQRRKKRPFLRILGPIGGKRKLSEGLFETAKRELLIDTGLTGEFKFKGILEVKNFREGKLFLHYVLNIFKITNLKGKIKTSTSKGDNIWISEEEYYKKKGIITGMKYHFNIVKSKSFMFVELHQYMNKRGNFIRSKIIREIKL